MFSFPLGYPHETENLEQACSGNQFVPGSLEILMKDWSIDLTWPTTTSLVPALTLVSATASLLYLLLKALKHPVLQDNLETYHKLSAVI